MWCASGRTGHVIIIGKENRINKPSSNFNKSFLHFIWHKCSRERHESTFFLAIDKIIGLTESYSLD